MRDISRPNRWRHQFWASHQCGDHYHQRDLVLGSDQPRSTAPFASKTADGKHLLIDVVSSGGVLVGVVLATLTGCAILDPILAALVALNVLWSGWGLLRKSVGGLLDVAVPQETQAQIRAIVASNAGGAIQAHDIRARQAGSALFVEFHFVVSSHMSIKDAHAICDRVEDNLTTTLGGW